MDQLPVVVGAGSRGGAGTVGTRHSCGNYVPASHVAGVDDVVCSPAGVDAKCVPDGCAGAGVGRVATVGGVADDAVV